MVLLRCTQNGSFWSNIFEDVWHVSLFFLPYFLRLVIVIDVAFYHLPAVQILSYDLSHTKVYFVQETAAHCTVLLFFFYPFHVNKRDGCVGKSQ